MKSYREINIILVLIFVTIIILIPKEKAEKPAPYDLPEILQKKELTVITLYSSISYFKYKNKNMGYQYDLCSKLANSLGITLKIKTAKSIEELYKMLDTKQGDLIAYYLPLTEKGKNKYIYCGYEDLSHQVLIQRKSNKPVRNVLGLIGKTVYIPRGTRYETRLSNLNEEIGGGINIVLTNGNKRGTENLIEEVAMKKIDYTISENKLAQINKTYFKNIDIETNISYNQKQYWVTRKSEKKLAGIIDSIFSNKKKKIRYTSLYKRYFEQSKGQPSPFLTTGKIIREDGSISDYDSIFKIYADSIGWDWRLLASIAYQESKFDNKAQSWVGARGLMQIMPRIAKSLGIDPDSLNIPQINIKASTLSLNSLEKSFFRIKDKEQRIKIVLAAYNAGLGHVLDARALTKKYGKDPNKWDGDNVSYYILNKSKPKYYNDPVCKSGYLRGYETATFVTEIWTRYNYYKEKIKED